MWTLEKYLTKGTMMTTESADYHLLITDEKINLDSS